MYIRNQKKLLDFMREGVLLVGLICGLHSPLIAGDVDVKLTTTDGSTKFSIQDSASAEVASVDSDGDGVFNTLTQSGTGGNLILSQNSLQSGATFYVSSGTVAGQLLVGNILHVGTSGAGQENYIAFPMTSGGAITAKQIVVLNLSGQVVTAAIASSNTVVGVAVTSAGGAGQTVWVTNSGIVSNVPCGQGIPPGARVCTSNVTAGDIGTCSSATSDGISVGRMLTSCTAATSGTVWLSQ